MKIIWRSTLLGKVQRRCLAVICYRERPEDRRIYGPGKVAHYLREMGQKAANEKADVLDPLEVQDVCEKSIASACEHGFSFEGQPEPPPRPDAALKGRDLAERWMLKLPPEPGFQAEVKFTIDRAGYTVKRDDPKAWATGIIDRIGIEEVVTDEGAYSVLAIEDDKTDWHSGSVKGDDGIPLSLDNAQRKLQALGGWDLYRDESFSAIWLKINSLRRLWTFDRVLDCEEMGILDEWRRGLLAVTDGYEARIERYGLDPEKLADPGAGCKGCSHFGHCAPGRAYLKDVGAEEPLEEMAESYAAHRAEVARLESFLRPAASELGAVVFGDTEVGFEEKERVRVRPEAASIVWRAWLRQPREGVSDEQDAFERDLLQSYLDGLKLGKWALNKLLARLWPLNRGNKIERDAKLQIRSEILAKCCEVELVPEFGVRKIPPPEPSLEEQLTASLKETE